MIGLWRIMSRKTSFRSSMSSASFRNPSVSRPANASRNPRLMDLLFDRLIFFVATNQTLTPLQEWPKQLNLCFTRGKHVVNSLSDDGSEHFHICTFLSFPHSPRPLSKWDLYHHSQIFNLNRKVVTRFQNGTCNTWAVLEWFGPCVVTRFQNGSRPGDGQY